MTEQHLLALDPPAETPVSTMGVCFLAYSEDALPRIIESSVVEGGFEGAAKWLRDVFGGLVQWPGTVIVEHWQPYNRAADSSHQLTEGLIRGLCPDAVLQPSSMMVTEAEARIVLPVLKAAGHHKDNISAARHAVAYLKTHRHMPTLRTLTDFVRQRHIDE